MNTPDREALSERFIIAFPKILDDFPKENKSTIAKKMDTQPNVVNSILKRERKITIQQLSLLITSFKLNKQFFYGDSSELYIVKPIAAPVVERENFELVGDRCKAIRKALGFSQEEMAKELNTSQPHWSRIENNDFQSIGDDIKLILHDKFNVRYEFMLNGQKPIVAPAKQQTFVDDSAEEHVRMAVQMVKEVSNRVRLLNFAPGQHISNVYVIPGLSMADVG